MSSKREAPEWPRTIALVLIPLVGAAGVWGNLGLFGDGSFFLLRLMAGPDAPLPGMWFGPFASNPERTLVTAIMQTPVVVAQGMGLHDLGLLTRLFSAGLVMTTSLVWFAAAWLQRHTGIFWLFMLMWASTQLVSGFFAIGEYNPTYALAGLAGSLVLGRSNASLWRSLALTMVSLSLLRSYESMLFLGPVLCVLTILSIRKGRPRGVSLALWRLSAVVFGVDAIAGLWSIFSPINPGSMGSAAAAMRLDMLSHDPRVVLSSLAVLGLLVMLFTANRTFGWSVVAGGLGAGFVAGMLPLVPYLQDVLPDAADAGWPPNWMYYNARIASGVLLLVLLLLAGLVHFSYRWSLDSRHGILVGAVCAGLSIAFVANTLAFAAWLGDFSGNIPQSGTIAWDQAGVSDRFVWQWTSPSLSVLLRSESSTGVLLNSESYAGWEPFDPRSVSLNIHQHP